MPESGSGRPCPWCGAPNPANATRCASCGSWIVSAVGPANDGETLIDVSSGEPRVVDTTPSPSARAGGVWVGANRAVFIRGGNRACLFATLALVLFICVQCVIAYYVFGWIF
ncbi:MAG: hypothetical protein DCC58_15785 [Chloroflexi bacterium]|nr:MAG: hypothetical protein DCC58_15785 [Chloroflexota bacterium]